MAYQLIEAQVDDTGVGLLTLSRPEKLNALTSAMRREISACLAAWGDDPAVGGVILTGAGRAFSAGFDLAEFEDPAGHAEVLASSSAYHLDVWRFPKPLLAAVNGLAAGGGFDLALLCDLRLCAEGAWFAHPELRHGAPPIFTPLRWCVGDGLARDLCLTRRRLPAEEARTRGLVRDVVPPQDLLPAARALMATVLEAPPDAVRFLKARMAASGGLGFEAAFAEEHDRAFREVLLGLARSPGRPPAPR